MTLDEEGNLKIDYKKAEELNDMNQEWELSAAPEPPAAKPIEAGTGTHWLYTRNF